MSLTLKTAQPSALIPALTNSLAQLQPAMQQTQESLQGLITKVTTALERSEERGRKLEAELIAAKAQQALDKEAYEARLKTQEGLNDTLQKTVAAMQKRITALEGQTKYIRPAVKAMVTYGAKPFIELDYPGKKEDLEQRKPILQDEIASLKLEIDKIMKDRGIAAVRASDKPSRLTGLEAESARIAAFEAREGKKE